jgi:hypothetical protein
MSQEAIDVMQRMRMPVRGIGLSTSFRMVLMVIAIAGLLLIAYQLADGEICIARRSWTCLTGANAWAAASGFALLCGAAGALALGRSWAFRAANACVYLGIACFLLMIPIGLLT